MSIKKTVVGKR